MSNIQRKADYTVKMAKQKLILELKNKNNKLQKALDVAMNGLSLACNKKPCGDSRADFIFLRDDIRDLEQKIQEILKGGE